MAHRSRLSQGIARAALACIICSCTEDRACITPEGGHAAGSRPGFAPTLIACRSLKLSSATPWTWSAASMSSMTSPHARFRRLRRRGRSGRMKPLKKVVGHVRNYVKREWSFGHPHASSITLQLECGHAKVQDKGSKPIPKRARCKECP